MNLRKDHCRNLPSRTTRELVLTSGAREPRVRASPPASRGRRPRPLGRASSPPRRNNEPRRGLRQGNLNERASSRRPGHGERAGGLAFFHDPKRLSATDISALASMKNVAKCDTWCELQNPVNHRVFERKLRPKPLGRGHVCLGVTHRRPPNPSPLRGRWGKSLGGRTLASRAPRLAVGPKSSSR